MKATKQSILSYLEEMKAHFAEEGIEDIALFGSFARLQNGVYSDVDIAIKKRSDYFDKFQACDYFATIETMKSLLRKKFHRNVDILDLDSTSPFIETIKKEMIYV